jgi:hypothetical protein
MGSDEDMEDRDSDPCTTDTDERIIDAMEANFEKSEDDNPDDPWDRVLGVQRKAPRGPSHSRESTNR